MLTSVDDKGNALVDKWVYDWRCGNSALVVDREPRWRRGFPLIGYCSSEEDGCPPSTKA